MAEVTLLVVEKDANWKQIDRQARNQLAAPGVVVDIPADAAQDGLVSAGREPAGQGTGPWSGLLVQVDLSMLVDPGPVRLSLQQAAQTPIKEADRNHKEDVGRVVNPTNPTAEPTTEAPTETPPPNEATTLTPNPDD